MTLWIELAVSVVAILVAIPMIRDPHRLFNRDEEDESFKAGRMRILGVFLLIAGLIIFVICLLGIIYL